MVVLVLPEDEDVVQIDEDAGDILEDMGQQLLSGSGPRGQTER